MRTRTTLALFLCLWLPTSLRAQLPTRAPLRLKVVTWSGERYEGLLDALTDSLTIFTFAERKTLAFDEIRRAVVYRDWEKKRLGALEGAVFGSVSLGLITNRSLQRNPPRSPVLYGLTLTMGVGAGGLAGGLAGIGIHRLMNRMVRISNRTRDGAWLRARLLALSYE